MRKLNALLTVISLALAIVFFTRCSGEKIQETESWIQQQEHQNPFAGTFKVSRYLFQNGLKLLVLEDHSSPTLAYQTWFNVGSRHEKRGYTGLAHLFEHLMFKATKTMPSGEFMKRLEAVGAEGLNAFTSNDYTAYVQEIPNQHLELLMRLEADRMSNLIVDEAAFKTEREVVHNERRMRYENSPQGKMHQNLFSNLYDTHPYGWPVIGYAEDLNRMNAADALDFYKHYYSPNQATIVIVGDVVPQKAAEALKKYYGDYSASLIPKENLPEVPEPTTEKRQILKLNTEVERLMIALPVSGVMEEETAVLEVVQGLLSEGKSSRLHKALVETGVATAVSSGNYQHYGPSIFTISVLLQKGQNAATAEKIVWETIKKLASSEITNLELERARNALKFAFYAGLNSSSGKASFLGRYETLCGRYERGLEIIYEMDEVKSDDIVNVLKKYFQQRRQTILAGVPL